jgi:hypothetical protein
MIVINDRNGNDLVYKIMILTNLALAGSINYDRKVCCKLKRTITIVKLLKYRPQGLLTEGEGTVQLTSVALII